MGMRMDLGSMDCGVGGCSKAASCVLCIAGQKGIIKDFEPRVVLNLKRRDVKPVRGDRNTDLAEVTCLDYQDVTEVIYIRKETCSARTKYTLELRSPEDKQALLEIASSFEKDMAFETVLMAIDGVMDVKIPVEANGYINVVVASEKDSHELWEAVSKVVTKALEEQHG